MDTNVLRGRAVDRLLTAEQRMRTGELMLSLDMTYTFYDPSTQLPRLIGNIDKEMMIKI